MFNSVKEASQDNQLQEDIWVKKDLHHQEGLRNITDVPIHVHQVAQEEKDIIKRETENNIAQDQGHNQVDADVEAIPDPLADDIYNQ
jgi:hypothetical protein